MRSFAVSCIFAYDFELREKRAAASETPKKPEKIKRSTDTVIISKPIRGTAFKRRTSMTRYEYEEQKKKNNRDVLNSLLEEAADDAALNESAAEEMNSQEEQFDVEQFIQDTLSVRLEAEGKEEVIFADLPDYNEYLYPVVKGVTDNIEEIDDAISRNMKNWAIDRIKRQDLAILRVAVFEMLKFSDVVPLKIAINEAVELAKANDEKSGGFVNGVLAGVAKDENCFGNRAE